MAPANLCSRFDKDNYKQEAGRTDNFDHCGNVNITEVGRRGEGRRGFRRRGPLATVAITMPDRDAIRRMEDIRRGGEGAVLADGVKSKRRGHLEGGRYCTVTFLRALGRFIDGRLG